MSTPSSSCERFPPSFTGALAIHEYASGVSRAPQPSLKLRSYVCWTSDRPRSNVW